MQKSPEDSYICSSRTKKLIPSPADSYIKFKHKCTSPLDSENESRLTFYKCASPLDLESKIKYRKQNINEP
jgi:hypothetical protein